MDDFSWDPQAAHFLKAVCRTVEESTSILVNRSVGVAAHLVTDKLAIAHRAAHLGIRTPQSIAVPFGRYARSVLPVVESVIGAGPYILKPREMGMGFGVVKADTAEQLSAMVDVVAQSGMGYLVQPFLPNHGDMRTFVAGGEVIAAEHRRSSPTGYLANVSQGGRPAVGKRVDVEEVSSMCRRVADDLQASLLSIDWLLTDRGPVLNEWGAGIGGFSALPEPDRTRVGDAFFGWVRDRFADD